MAGWTGLENAKRASTPDHKSAEAHKFRAVCDGQHARIGHDEPGIDKHCTIAPSLFEDARLGDVDVIAEQLLLASEAWRQTKDHKALRRVLLSLLSQLEDLPAGAV